MRAKINDIAEIQIGYQFREKLDPSSDGMYQVIQVKDIDESTGFNLKDVILSRVTPDRDASKYEVTGGDVIFLSKGRRNYATSIDGLYDHKTIVASNFFILKLNDSRVLPEFLAWAINQSPAQGYLQSMARGTGIPFVSKEDFAELEIDIPDLNTQKAIIELHKLSLKESSLLEQLRTKRENLVRAVCINSTKHNHH